MRAVHVILILGFISSLAFAAGVIQWNATFGGSGLDYANSAEQTVDGGYVIAGYTNSTGAGGYDFWLVKTNSTGGQEWNVTFGGTGTDYGYSAQQTADAGYIIAGHTNSTGAGYYDIWLVKTNSTGGHEWNVTFGGTGTDRAYSVRQTADGGYVIAGYTNSSGAGGMDALFVKTNPAGGEEWNVTFGGSGNEQAQSVQQAADGGYVLAGITTSFGAGGYDAWLVKTNSTGGEEWNATFGGPDHDGAQSVKQTSDGGYILAGYTVSFGAGNYSAWLVKTNSTGGEEWNATFGGSSNDVAYSAQQTADGGYIAAGYTASFGAGNSDFWLIKTNSTGGEQWNATFGGSGTDSANSVQQTTDGGYILAGITSSFGAGSYDFWLVKVYNDSIINSCQVINSPGSYQLLNNLTGAPNNASELGAGAAACVKIVTSNVTFDCNGFGIANNGTSGTTYGVFAPGWPSLYSNITIRNCPGITGYSNGVYLYYTSNSTITNSTVSNSDTAFSTLGGSYNTFENDTALNSSTGFFIYGQNNITNNNAFGGGGHGFNLYFADGSRLVNNTALNFLGDGFLVTDTSYDHLENNTACNNTQSGFELTLGQATPINTAFNNFTGNIACNNGWYGFYLLWLSRNNNFTGNDVYGNGFDGVRLTVGPPLGAFSVSDNTFINNSIHNNSGDGIYGFGAFDEDFINNSVYGNGWNGIYIERGGLNTFANNTIHGNSQYGVYLLTSALEGNNFSGDHFYNNHPDLRVEEDGDSFVTTMAVNISGEIFDNPSGNFSNYTNLSISDLLNYSGLTLYFQVNWSASPAAQLSLAPSFAQKFIDISGSGTIDNITWSWSDDEVSAGGYNESRFTLYNYSSGTWAMMDASLDTTANTLNLSGFSPASTYGILQRNDFIAPAVVLNSPDNGAVLNDSLAAFNFTATDDSSATMSCSLYVNGTLRQTDLAVANNTPTVLSVGLANGSYDGYVACIDGAMNLATSETRNLTVNSSIVCPLIDSSGSYQLAGNVYGAPNNLSELGGNGSCVRITASDVDFDCRGYNLTGPGTGLTTAGVAIIGPVSNVTVRDCNISGYSSGGGPYLSDGAQFINNTVSGNSIAGFALFQSTNTLLANNTVFSNGGTSFGFFGGGGSLIISSDGTRIINDHYYGNSVGIAIDEFFGAPFTLNMSGVIFDNPTGNFQNYTTLSLNDTIQIDEAYTINWSSSPAFPPAGNSSFRQKFIDITSPTGTSIDRITWGWRNWETSGYDERSLALLGYDGAAWVDMNATLDTTVHTLNASDFVPASIYGILGDRTDYVFIPPSESSMPPGGFRLNASTACPGNIVDIYAYTSSGPLSGVSVRAVLAEPYEGLVSENSTDSGGHAVFHLASAGTYEFYGSKTGYSDSDVLRFSFTSCAMPRQLPANATEPGNVTPPEQSQAQPPVVQPSATMEQAQQAIADAQAAISDAQAGGKDVAAAQEKLAESQAAFDAGDYQDAKDLADETKQLALNAAASGPQTAPPPAPPPTAASQPPAQKESGWMPLVVIGVTIAVAVAVGAAVYWVLKGTKRR